MKILICGGRTYRDDRFLDWMCQRLVSRWGMQEIIEGEAPGADTMAREWGEAHRMPVQKFPAQWRKFGNAAGKKRNQQMIDEGEPNMVVALPGHTGTADMIRRAKKANLLTIEIHNETQQHHVDLAQVLCGHQSQSLDSLWE